MFRKFTGIAILLLLSGCESTPEGRHPVAKTDVYVTLKGEPVEGANITFYALDKGNIPGFGLTDANGKATITTYDPGDGAIVGSNSAIVTKMKLDSKAQTGEVADQDSPDYDPLEPPSVAPPKNLLPKKYSLITTSGLKAEITKQALNEIRFELDDK
ncbi:MAG: Ig-like domain-containing protein [Planctomycetales bacterium]|nr:Ig-like domain-containing protein [Planctomycetales bacterium]